VSARRVAPARPLAVTTAPATGLPTGLRWRGRDERVARVEVTWTLDIGWWAEEADVVRRHYVRLVTHNGLHCVIFHDLTVRRWYLDTVID
jgi:hypothetical protein